MTFILILEKQCQYCQQVSLGFLEHECIIVTLKVLSRMRFFSQWSEQRTLRWKCTERDFKWITLNYICLFLFKEDKSYLV